jgi:hypothetical protein
MVNGNGMYTVTGMGWGGTRETHHGTLRQANEEKARRDEDDKRYSYPETVIGTTDIIGAYPRDDPRYEE